MKETRTNFSPRRVQQERGVERGHYGDHQLAPGTAPHYVGAAGPPGDLYREGGGQQEGDEAGPNHRMPDEAWVTQIRNTCQAADVAFFFKQWGGRTPKAGGRLLDGRTWD